MVMIMLMTRTVVVESTQKRRIANMVRGGVVTAPMIHQRNRPIDIDPAARKIANMAKRMTRIITTESRHHVTRRNPNTATKKKENINHPKPKSRPNKNHSKTKLPKLIQQNYFPLEISLTSLPPLY